MLTRPRLRSKVGCLTCRRRRKKCDEKKPRCRDCSRHDLHCTWPCAIAGTVPRSPGAPRVPSGPGSLVRPLRSLPDLSERYQAAATAIPLRPEPPYRPLPARTAREHDLFQHFINNLVPLLVRSESHPRYLNIFALCIAANTHTWVMDIYLGLSILHMSKGNGENQSIAHQYYCSALVGYRRKIENGELRGTEDWLLSSAIFFCLFEKWRSSAVCNTISHLEGIAEILRLRRMQNPPADNRCTSPADRLASESFLYHISTVSLFCQDLDRISSKFSWADVIESLGYGPFPDTLEDGCSPIMDLPPTFYHLAFEITRLSRHVPLQQSAPEAIAYMQELDTLRVTLNSLSAKTNAASEPGKDFCISALEIFLFKLIRPVATAADSQVQTQVERAVRVIKAGVLDGIASPGSAFLCWALAVLACATDSRDHMQLFKEQLARRWCFAFSGHIRRTACVVEHIWEWRTQHKWHGTSLGDQTPKDGLQLLTRRDGLYRFLYT